MAFALDGCVSFCYQENSPQNVYSYTLFHDFITEGDLKNKKEGNDFLQSPLIL